MTDIAQNAKATASGIDPRLIIAGFLENNAEMRKCAEFFDKELDAALKRSADAFDKNNLPAAENAQDAATKARNEEIACGYVEVPANTKQWKKEDLVTLATHPRGAVVFKAITELCDAGMERENVVGLLLKTPSQHVPYSAPNLLEPKYTERALAAQKIIAEIAPEGMTAIEYATLVRNVKTELFSPAVEMRKAPTAPSKSADEGHAPAPLQNVKPSVKSGSAVGFQSVEMHPDIQLTDNQILTTPKFDATALAAVKDLQAMKATKQSAAIAS